VGKKRKSSYEVWEKEIDKLENWYWAFDTDVRMGRYKLPKNALWVVWSEKRGKKHNQALTYRRTHDYDKAARIFHEIMVTDFDPGYVDIYLGVKLDRGIIHQLYPRDWDWRCW